MKSICVFSLAIFTFAHAYAEVRKLKVSKDSLSPSEAIETIRKERNNGYRGAWEIRVSSGVHEVKETIEILPEDSVTVDAPINWIGEDGAILCGGKVIEGWKETSDGLWVTDAPCDKSGKIVFFESLYAFDRRLERAKLFDFDELKMLDDWHESAVTNKDGTVTWVETIRIDDPRIDVFAKMSKEELSLVRYGVIAKWSFGCFSPVSFNPKTREFKFHLKKKLYDWGAWTPRGNNHSTKSIIRFENVRSGLEVPGSWFYDGANKKIFYRPLAGEKISEFKPYAPTSGLVNLIRMQGDVEKGDFVHDINFKNIAFTGTTSAGERLPSGLVQQYQLQAAYLSSAAIFGEGVHRVTFDKCQVRDTENYGIFLGRGCVSNKITNSKFTNLGAGGIWLGDTIAGPQWMTKTKSPGLIAPAQNRIPLLTKKIHYMDNPANAFNVIDNCEVSLCGRVNPEGCGIVFTHVSDSTITHCDIHDLYYTGVSLGWTWGFLGSVAQRNTVSFNRIWDIGKGIMSDMGGVYTLGASFGTSISNNIIHSVKAFAYGGWGLYNDEGSEGIVMENNLVYDTSNASYNMHYGRENVVRNNILAYADTHQISFTCTFAQRLVTFENNIIYSHGKNGNAVFKPPRVFYDTTYADIHWSSNIIWSASGVVNSTYEPYSPLFFGMDRIKEKTPPYPLHYSNITGFFTDPKFENVEKRDFRIKDDSPVLKYGFKPWDFSLSGLRKNK